MVAKTAERIPTLEEVDNYPVPELLIPRIASVHGYSLEDASNLVKEAKRMLFLNALTRKHISPSLQVDDAWHEMLMFTRFYQAFCDFLGFGFIHHDPTPGPPDGGKLYECTKERYQQEFGVVPDKRYWKD